MSSAVVQGIYNLVKAPFEAAHPTVPLIFENQPFDWNNPPPAFVFLEVEFHGGDQIGMAASPKTRTSGYVYACAYARDGVGVLDSIRQLETLSGLLGYATVGAARLQAPELTTDKSPPKGWNTKDLKVAFYADSP